MDIPKESYKLGVIEEKIGGLSFGGENTMPFYLFEGDMPNPPRIGLEVLDEEPKDWPKTLVEAYNGVLADPVSWAKKCVEYGASLVSLRLISTDPTGSNKTGEEVSEIVKNVLDAIDVPLIIQGSGNIEKDGVVLKEISGICSGKNVIIGPATEGNYKSIGASAMAYGHLVCAQTPIDVNLAKQLNILLGNLGLSDEKILIDPSGSTLGYGLEYVYSIIERIKLACLQSGDDKLRMPIFVDIGKDCWKIKETREERKEWGDVEKRGILWEAITGLSFIIAGANIVIMRHPKAMKLVKEITMELMYDLRY